MKDNGEAAGTIGRGYHQNAKRETMTDKGARYKLKAKRSH